MILNGADILVIAPSRCFLGTALAIIDESIPTVL